MPRARLLAFAALAAMTAFVVLYGLDGTPMRPYDEGLYGRLARNLLATDVWIHAAEADGTFSEKFSKPPLSLWLTAWSMRAFGPSMFSLRLPFALGMIGVIAIATAWGARARGARFGLVWGATLALSTATLRWGRYASIEPLFVAFGMLALWSHAEAFVARGRRAAWWGLAAGAGLTLAFLTKQLAVGLFVLPILVAEAAAWRRHGAAGRLRRVGLTLVTPTVLGGAWLWGAWRRAGDVLLDTFFVRSVGGRMVGLDEAHNQRSLNEVATIVSDVVDPFPWIVGIVALAVAWWLGRDRGDASARPTPLAMPMLVLLVTATALYDHAAATLLPWYAFAFVPPIAAGLAFAVDATATVTRQDPPVRWALAAAGALVLGIAVVVALAPWMSQLDVALGVATLAVVGVRGTLADPRRRARVLAVAYALVFLGTLRNVEFRQGPGPLEQLMRELGARGLEVVAVDANTGAAHEIEYKTYFGPDAVKVRAPPWRRAVPGVQAFVTSELPPSELPIPDGLELVRANGAVAWIGDVSQPGWETTTTDELLDAGELTFEAEHMATQRVETLVDDATASGGRARAAVPFAGERLGQFLLSSGPQWLLAPGRYEATFWLRWRCPAEGATIGRLWIVGRGQDLAKVDLECEEGDRERYDGRVVAFSVARPTRIELRVVYAAGELWHDKTTIRREGG